MKINFGLISCDSHAQLHKDNWTSRMSKAKWGDAIPQWRETTTPLPADVLALAFAPRLLLRYPRSLDHPRPAGDFGADKAGKFFGAGG